MRAFGESELRGKPNMERTITLGGVFDDGADLEIRESELPTITDEELQRCGILRETLHRCFAEGVELIKDYTERDRVRPIAEHTGDGPDDWGVVIVGYPPDYRPADAG